MPGGEAPAREDPAEEWEHYDLYRRVKQAVLSLPPHFESETFIAGVLATDLHTLNPVLGASIEEQVVATLNSMRGVWDPDDEYALYSFVRQPQTFPDVLLRRPGGEDGDADRTILGIELKGWYLLAKEGMPNFRFSVTPEACNPQDLIVVVPWALAQVLSGRPMVMTPYVESAKHAALYRNYWWQHVRETDLDTAISLPGEVAPYPSKTDEIHDRPAADSGSNFGRYARTGLMNNYLKDMKGRMLCGIKVDHWLAFFRAFHEGHTSQAVRESLGKLSERISKEVENGNDRADALGSVLQGLEKLVGEELPDPVEEPSEEEDGA